MDKQFAYLNFHTEYSSKGTEEVEMNPTYCFSRIFYGDEHQDNEYEIIVYKKMIGQENNICLLSKEELINFINFAKKNIYDFEFSVEDHDKNTFSVKAHIDAPRIVHRYILTWIRYCYEFPFNMYLFDAIRFNKTKGHKRQNIFNIYNVIAASSEFYFHGDNIHSIGNPNWARRFYTIKEQQDIVKNANPNGEVNDLFPEEKIILKSIYQKDKDRISKIKSLDIWTSEEEFKKRLTVYNKNYNTIKNYEKK